MLQGDELRALSIGCATRTHRMPSTNNRGSHGYASCAPLVAHGGPLRPKPDDSHRDVKLARQQNDRHQGQEGDGLLATPVRALRPLQ
jgi:hypothetical protein